MAKGLERRLLAVMFTDMVGYTALMQADEGRAVEKRDLYVDALERQHDDAGGTIVQRLGDGSLSTFPSALAAVGAAVAMQRELAPAGVPVRIGIHVGDVIVEPERLTGDAVNVAARVESFAVPGSVLLSDTAYEQIKNQPGVEVAALGSFRLKNVGRPVDLYAAAGSGLVVPDRETLAGKGEAVVAIRAAMPEPGGPILGRHRELAALTELVREHRVVTLTGPGGVGKTRLVTELAHALAPEFPDGTAFVGFADVTDEAELLPALGAALDVKEAEERSVLDGIAALLGERKVLLVLDNLEQIVGAAPDVAELARRSPELRIVVTSRIPLRIAAEHLYPVDPLPAEDAVALFAARAAALSPDFRMAEHADAVAEICRRLDGLPLALELAAARLRLLGAEGLRDRLDRTLELLTTGARDSHDRQRTLRATIGWSYSLLDESQQRVFRRLAVFAGGCALPDAEAVAGAGTLDELESLVDAALVQANGRLRMLQTIADFAREQLDESGEAAEVGMRHARVYADVAREIRDGVEGIEQLAALERGIREEENLDAALDTLLAAARAGDGDATERGLQMSGDLWMYWHIRGKNLTARDYAAAFLELAGEDATPGRAGALITAGLGSWMSGRYEQSRAEWDEAYAAAAAVGAERELCIAAFARALALMMLDPVSGLAVAREAFERGRGLGFAWGEGIGATVTGMLETVAGDDAAAAENFSHALDIQQRLGDWEGGGMSLGGLASLAVRRGDVAQALELYERSLGSFEACGDRGEEARILSEMAWTHLASGDTTLARRRFFDSVQAHTDIASMRGVGLSLVGLAAAAAVDGRYERAAQIAAAAEVLAEEEGIVVVYSDETPGRELVDQARAALSAEQLARAAEVGRGLSLADALELARTGESAPA
ncbi:MAG TPA: tetratricopeptide repeat protein [Gaiellaceae bacterium]|nr:tetratricopeptide repeat protein [Gaiellaceae bacterium]